MLKEFECKKCHEKYEELTKYDPTNKYKSIKCPKCGSKRKTPLVSVCNWNFTNPVGTDRWNNSHDYRFKTKLPQAKAERANAAKAAKAKTGFTSKTPYSKIDDISSGKHEGPVK